MNPEPDVEFVSINLKFESDPPGTPASPRPSAPRREASDNAFASELADRVREYVRDRPTTGLTAEQLAALVQQLLAHRSA